jgi:16S rRNA processing protein RimM
MPAASKTQALVPLGVVIGAHGVRGELRVKPYNPSSDLLETLDQVILRPAGAADGRTIAVHSARRHGEGLLLTIAGCNDRDAALALRGAELCVTRAQLPAAEPGEHYLIDLVGLEARLAESGAVLGKVSDTIDYPASCVLCIETERGAIEIPMHERYVIEVRLDEGTVIVDHVDELELQPARRG